MRIFPRITLIAVLMVLVLAYGSFAATDNKAEAQKHFVTAQSYQKSGRLDQAITEYSAGLKLTPNSVPALTNLAIIYAQRKQLANAESAYRKILVIEPKNTMALEQLVRVLMSEGKANDALPVARTLMGMKPADKRYRRMFGSINVALKDYVAAADVFRTAIHMDPSDQESYIDLAGCYIATKDYNGVLETMGQLLKINPKSPQARMTAAFAAEKIGDNSLAIKHYEAASTGPAAAPALMSLARLYQTMKQPEKSVDAFKRLVKVDKNNFDALFNLGAYEYNKQRWKQAETYWVAAKRVRPDEFNVNLNLAMAQARQGTKAKFKEALVGTTVAVGAQPKSALALEAHGYVLENLGEISKAMQVYQRWEKLDPDNATPSQKLAMLYLYRNNPAKAWPEFDIAVKRAPKSAEVRVAYGNALAAQAQYGKAYEQFQKAMALDPKNAQTMVRAGVCLQLDKKISDATKLLEKAVATDSDLVEARMRLGLLYKDQNMNEKAIEQFAKLVRLDPKDTQSAIQLAQLYEAQGDYSSEADVCRTLLKSAGETDGAYYRTLLANALEKIPDHAGALEQYTEMAKSKDQLTRITGFKGSGAVLEKMNRPAEALAAYKSVIELQPNSESVLTSIGSLYQANKQNDEFYAYLKSLIDTGNGNLPFAFYANVLRKAGRGDEAIKTLESAATRLPDNIQVSLVLASEYLSSGQKDKAVERYKMITAKYPEDPTANKALGAIYRKNGQIQEAVSCMAIAVKQLGSDKQLVRDLGDLYYSMPDKRTEALNTYRAYLKLDPACSEVRQRVGEMEAGAVPPPATAPATPAPK